MNASFKKPMRSKALLAIAFAGGILNSQLPALSETESKSESTDSVTQKLANQPGIATEERAFWLLCLARNYLTNGNKDEIEKRFTTIVKEITTHSHFNSSRYKELVFVNWADMVSSDVQSRNIKNNQNTNAEAKPDSHSVAEENRVLAAKAIHIALSQFDKVTDKFARLNLYFIGARLFQEAKDIVGMRKCDQVLEEALKACEGTSSIDEEQTKAAISILNSMANGLIPVKVPDLNPKDGPLGSQPAIKPFTERDFKESEKLKLRAVAMADRLATTDHQRRKAHRDMSLWYMLLGKKELAEREKQILFELVGCKDDIILYPQRGGCGHLVWWQKERVIATYDCGMG